MDTAPKIKQLPHRLIGQLLLTLHGLCLVAILAGAVTELASQFYLGLFAAIPVLLSAIVIYYSLLQHPLPLAWGYLLLPVSLLMSGSYASFLLRKEHDALDTLSWLTLPVGHVLMLLGAVVLHLLSRLIIDKFRSRSNHQQSS